MKLKVVVCLLAFVWLFGSAAQAQDVSKFDVFAGYFYVRTNNPFAMAIGGGVAWERKIKTTCAFPRVWSSTSN
jgi:hypothetical protein